MFRREGGYRKVFEIVLSVVIWAGEKYPYRGFRLEFVLREIKVLTFGGGKYEYLALEFTSMVSPVRELNEDIERVLNDDVRNWQKVLAVFKPSTKEETNEPTVEMPIGRIVDGKRFTETSFNTVLK